MDTALLRCLGTAWLLAAALVLGAGPAQANERHFTYTYETAVLSPGERELEVWTTVGLGRESRYVRFDERLEFEVGVVSGLQTAFYLNLSATSTTVAGELVDTFSFQGVSNEWKFKVSDAVADPLGFAVYGEVLFAPDEIEFEAKLIFDKKVGDVLLAANLVVETEWEFAPGKTLVEVKPEVVLAATYFFTPRFAVGLELRNTNVISDAGWEFSALFLGPVVSYGGNGWWVALTLLPQLPAFTGGNPLVLTDHEKFAARLLFSFHL